MDMDEEEEGEVFMRKARAGHWWEDCGDDGSCDTQHHRGGMVNSRSWAEELQDIFAPRAEDCYSGGRTRLSSISVSDCISLFLSGDTQAPNATTSVRDRAKVQVTTNNSGEQKNTNNLKSKNEIN